MRPVGRREFLATSGRWLLLAGATALAPALSGCARLLRWSESQTRTGPGAASEVTGTTTVVTGPEGGSSAPTGPPTPTTGTGDIGGGSGGGPQTTSSSPGASTTSTPPATASAHPDLVVIRGDAPDRNVREALNRLGGMERFVKKGATVVVKPNVLTGRAPEYAVTTNPLVVAALVRLCWEAGAARVTVLDYPTTSPRAAFKESGIAQAVEEAGGTVKYLSNRNFERVEIPDGAALTSWPLVTDVLEADTFINVPIGKTHGLAGLTLAMKNLMGIMGDPRGRIHTGYPTKITDINTRVRQHLVVLDACRVLVRNGPTGGSLRDVAMPKTVVAGTSPVAVDAYGCTIMGWRPTDLPSLVEAEKRGLGTTDLTRYVIYEGTA
jgi:uncharacterized protein (DUF362 family)